MIIMYMHIWIYCNITNRFSVLLVICFWLNSTQLSSGQHSWCHRCCILLLLSWLIYHNLCLRCVGAGGAIGRRQRRSAAQSTHSARYRHRRPPKLSSAAAAATHGGARTHRSGWPACTATGTAWTGAQRRTGDSWDPRTDREWPGRACGWGSPVSAVKTNTQHIHYNCSFQVSDNILTIANVSSTTKWYSIFSDVAITFQLKSVKPSIL